ncbi:MAG TPA: glycosyltransferase [Acidobacteriota bacterium]|nr:glycosyltransferase [Acidobacteriota bacterium]
MKTSVIIAAKNGSESIKDCLNAWKAQLHATDEIIVAHAEDDSTAEIVQRHFPAVRLVELEKKALVPDLLSAGIFLASGEIIAVTSTNFIPRDAWIKHARILMASGLSGAGGAVENNKNATLTDTAVYFCKYWRFMPPFKSTETDHLPSENAIYRLSDLLKFRGAIRDGFWESDINSLMKQEGLHLLLTQDLTAVHKYGAGILNFFVNCIRYGSHYARERSISLGLGQCLLNAIGSPFTPFVHLKRIRNAAEKDSRRKKALMRATALLFLFLVGWALGEARGYIAGPLEK